MPARYHAIRKSTCSVCASGTFYPGEGSDSECAKCPPGYACNTTGIVLPTVLCAPGYFCLQGAWTRKPAFGPGGDCDETSWEPCDYGPCPVGYACPEGTGSPVLCQPGSFANEAMMASCATCPASQYCDGYNTATTIDCPRGHYCPRGTGIPPPKCPEGVCQCRCESLVPSLAMPRLFLFVSAKLLST